MIYSIRIGWNSPTVRMVEKCSHGNDETTSMRRRETSMEPLLPQSLDFYRHHSQEYARVSASFLESGYVDLSNPQIKGDADLTNWLMALAPGRRGLDAGCGSGAKEVHALCSQGYDVIGLDAVEENLQVAAELHPEIADRLYLADLTQTVPFPDTTFDFVLCRGVIQHISPEVTKEHTLPELIRVLRSGGILQLMFKNGHGMKTVSDGDYGGISRSFHLYDENELLALLESYDCHLVAQGPQDAVGGLVYITDAKPMQHCAFHVIKG